MWPVNSTDVQNELKWNTKALKYYKKHYQAIFCQYLYATDTCVYLDQKFTYFYYRNYQFK